MKSYVKNPPGVGNLISIMSSRTIQTEWSTIALCFSLLRALPSVYWELKIEILGIMDAPLSSKIHQKPPGHGARMDCEK